MEYMKRIKWFDPSKGGKRHNFIQKIISQKVWDLKWDRLARKKEMAQHTEYIGDQLEIIEEIYSQQQSDSEETLHLTADMERVLTHLPDYLMELAITLKTMTITEASEYLNLHRSTIYDRMAKIRRIFRAFKLDQYLKE